MLPSLIALSGKQYAGKDHVADWLLKRLSGYRKSPIARALKIAYAQRHGLTLEALEANKAQHRPGLIAMGDWGRRQREDYWLSQALAQAPPLIIPDVRLRPEYDALRARGAFLIRVEACREVRALRGRLTAEDDLTERDLDAICDWDAVIENHGSQAALEATLETLLPAMEAFACAGRGPFVKSPPENGF